MEFSVERSINIKKRQNICIANKRKDRFTRAKDYDY